MPLQNIGLVLPSPGQRTAPEAIAPTGVVMTWSFPIAGLSALGWRAMQVL